MATFRWQKWGRGRCRRVVVVACSSSPRRRCASTAVLTHPLALAVKRSSDACCGAAAAAPARLQRGSDCEGHLGVQRLSGAPGAAAIVRGTRGLQRFARDVVVSSSSCRIVVAVTSSSRRRRRRVVVSRLGAARVAMFGPCRCVVAVSSPLVAVAVAVVFVARRRRRRRLYPHPRPSPPVLVVALSCVRLCPTAILTPRPSPPVLVVAQSCHPPPPLSSPNPHRYPRPRPTTHPQHLYLKPVMEGGCSDCEDLGLGALQRGWGCSGAWGLQLLWGPGHCSEAGGLQGAAAS